MNKRLWSSVMAGVMAVTSSAVLEIQSFAEEESVTLKTAALGGWESCGDILLASAGVLTENSIIRVTATAGIGLTEENDSGETVTPTNVFGIVCDNEWNRENENYISVPYNSETGVSSYDITYSKLSAISRINIQSNLHSEITITVEAIGFAEDTRSEASVAKIASPISITIEEQQDWIVGNHGGEFVKDAVLSSAWSGKTVSELREAVGKFSIPAMDFHSDSASAGASAFMKNLIIRFEDENWEACGSQTAFTSGGVDYIDSLFTDNTHDNCVISEIGLWVETAYSWDNDLMSNACHNEAINGLGVGDTIIIEPVEDSHDVLTLSEPSGAVEMNAYNEDNDWYEGINALGDYSYTGAPEGITLGTTTLKQLKDNYKSISVPAVPFFGCTLSGVTGSDFQYTLNIDLEDSDGNYVNVWGDTNSFNTKTFSVDNVVTSNDDVTNLEDYVITGFSLNIRPKSNYNEETGKNYTASSVIKNLNDGDTFIVEFTEDKRKVISLPEAEGSVEMYVYSDSNWLDTVCAFGDIEFDSAPEGITYGETTLKDFMDNYKAFSVSEIPFFSSELNGVTASDLCYEVDISVEEIDGDAAYDLSSGTGSLSAATIGVDNMLVFSDITDPEKFVITDIYIRITAKTEYNPETGKNSVVCEAIKALDEDDTFIIELTEDTREVITIPDISGEVEIGLWTSDMGLEAGGSFNLENVSGITYGTTTLKQLKEGYKKISVPAVPFFGCDLDGVEADDLRYSVAIDFKNDGSTVTVWGESNSLGAQSFSVDNMLAVMLEEMETENPDEYVVDNISLFIRAKTDDNGAFVSEAIRELDDGDSFTVYFTEPKSNVPENIKATAGEEQVTLTWDAVDGAAGYLIKSADGKTQYTKTIKTTSYTVTGLTGGTKYSFMIYAYVDGKWYASEAVSAVPTVGAYPKNVKAEALNRSIKLSWDAVDGAAGYLIKSADGKTQYTKTIKTTSYTVTGLKNGTQYQFKVYAYVDGKWRGSSRISKTPVAKPQNVVAAAGSHQIKLTWDKVDNVTGYIIKSSDGSTQYTPKSISANSYTVTGLKNGTQYKFKVYAYSDGKWFTSSTVSKTPTGAPQNVKAAAGSKSITLSWDAVDGAAGYLIKSADGKTQYTKTIKTTSYTIKNLTAGTQYKFKVYAYVDGKWYASGAKSKTPKA